MAVGEGIPTHLFDFIGALYGLQKPTSEESPLWNCVDAIYENVNHMLWDLSAGVDENLVIHDKY